MAQGQPTTSRVRGILLTSGLCITRHIECVWQRHEKIHFNPPLPALNFSLSPRLIKELIDCGEKKLANFFVTIEPLMLENVRLVDKLSNPELSTIKILFVNLHTAKGAARTLGLSHLSSVIHEAEQYYSDLIKDKAEFSLDRLQSDIQLVRSCFEKYVQINRVELGRDFDPNLISVSRRFLSEQLGILTGLNQWKSIPDENIQSNVAKSIDQINNFIFSNLIYVLETSFAQVGRIAKDLGKMPPEMDFIGEFTAIPKEVEILLEKIVVHIARNIMDHGIESAEERLAMGKPAAGRITIKTEQLSGKVIIMISDDGRGLAVGKLRKKLSSHSPQLAATASAEVIAETIFDVGVSTAANVSHI